MAESSKSTPITPAISRDGFTFTNGQLYVNVDGHLHKREDAATLYVLLNFVPPPAPLTKDGKVSKKPANTDREAHYYTAQLLHYGLPSLKTRDPAKKKLLAAYGGANGKTLDIPQRILDLEAALNKEWREMDAKLAKKEAAKNKKRKAETAELNTDMVAESSKKAKPAAPVLKPKTKTQIRKDIAVLPEEAARKLLTKLLADVPAVEGILATELAKLDAKAATAATKEAKAKNTTKDSGSLDPSKWTGSYTVRAPKLAENWDMASGPLSLEVYPSSTSAHIWASFNFGIVSGVMRSRGSVPSSFNVPIPFEWRGREAGEDVMTFSSRNTGVITFTSEGKIGATMDGDLCGQFTFSGEFQARGGKAAPPKIGPQQRQAVKTWKSEWRGINQRNYDIENTGRWGKWSGEPREENAFESDTTAGHRRHDSDEDVEMREGSWDAYECDAY